MTRVHLSHETLASLLFDYLTGKQVPDAQQRKLDLWAKLSVYNQSILHDLKYDEKLRAELLGACQSDKALFWKILLTHRAALHSFMPPRAGNFWKRLVRPLVAIFKRNIADSRQ